MQGYVRTQIDGRNDEYSDLTGIDCSNDVDRARQEDAAFTDLNKIMATFGMNPFDLQTRRPAFGDINYDSDLQQHLNAVRTAQEGYDRLAPHIRELYPDLTTLLIALHNGDLTQDDLKPKPETAPPAAPAAPTP